MKMEEAVALLKRAASHDPRVKGDAVYEIAKAFETPVREAVLMGQILDNIFEVVPVSKGTTLEYPIDIVTQGNVKNHKAYNIPMTGAIAERYVSSDYIKVNTFDVGSSIDCAARLLEIGNWDIMKRLVDVLTAGFVEKMNDDGWRLLISAGYGRGLTVVDSAAAQGFLTKKLVRSLKTTMLRYGGGNSSSVGLRTLTDLYTSLEALDDMHEWDLTQIDDVSRREIFLKPDGLSTVFGVKLHGLFELGVGQAYQNYWASIGGTLEASKEEIVVGLSLNKRDSFVMASESPVEIFEDPNFHRQRKFSLYAWTRYGMAVLDDRPILLGQI